MTYNTPEEKEERIHEILSRLTDEEYWTIMGSQRAFELFGLYHVAECRECAVKERRCDKLWGADSSKVPILTPFQREIRRMEGEIKVKKINLEDDPDKAFNLVDSTFTYFKGDRIDS